VINMFDPLSAVIKMAIHIAESRLAGGHLPAFLHAADITDIVTDGISSGAFDLTNLSTLSNLMTDIGVEANDIFVEQLNHHFPLVEALEKILSNATGIGDGDGIGDFPNHDTLGLDLRLDSSFLHDVVVQHFASGLGQFLGDIRLTLDDLKAGAEPDGTLSELIGQMKGEISAAAHDITSHYCHVVGISFLPEDVQTQLQIAAAEQVYNLHIKALHHQEVLDFLDFFSYEIQGSEVLDLLTEELQVFQSDIQNWNLDSKSHLLSFLINDGATRSGLGHHFLNTADTPRYLSAHSSNPYYLPAHDTALQLNNADLAEGLTPESQRELKFESSPNDYQDDLELQESQNYRSKETPLQNILEEDTPSLDNFSNDNDAHFSSFSHSPNEENVRVSSENDYLTIRQHYNKKLHMRWQDSKGSFNSTGYSHGRTIYNSHHNKVGYCRTGDGSIFDWNHSPVGRVDGEGNVFDAEGDHVFNTSHGVKGGALYLLCHPFKAFPLKNHPLEEIADKQKGSTCLSEAIENFIELFGPEVSPDLSYEIQRELGDGVRIPTLSVIQKIIDRHLGIPEKDSSFTSIQAFDEKRVENAVLNHQAVLLFVDSHTLDPERYPKHGCHAILLTSAGLNEQGNVVYEFLDSNVEHQIQHCSSEVLGDAVEEIAWKYDNGPKVLVASSPCFRLLSSDSAVEDSREYKTARDFSEATSNENSISGHGSLGNKLDQITESVQKSPSEKNDHQRLDPQESSDAPLVMPGDESDDDGLPPIQPPKLQDVASLVAPASSGNVEENSLLNSLKNKLDSILKIENEYRQTNEYRDLLNESENIKNEQDRKELYIQILESLPQKNIGWVDHQTIQDIVSHACIFTDESAREKVFLESIKRIENVSNESGNQRTCFLNTLKTISSAELSDESRQEVLNQAIVSAKKVKSSDNQCDLVTCLVGAAKYSLQYPELASEALEQAVDVVFQHPENEWPFGRQSELQDIFQISRHTSSDQKIFETACQKAQQLEDSATAIQQVQDAYDYVVEQGIPLDIQFQQNDRQSAAALPSPAGTQPPDAAPDVTPSVAPTPNAGSTFQQLGERQLGTAAPTPTAPETEQSGTASPKEAAPPPTAEINPTEETDTATALTTEPTNPTPEAEASASDDTSVGQSATSPAVNTETPSNDQGEEQGTTESGGTSASSTTPAPSPMAAIVDRIRDIGAGDTSVSSPESSDGHHPAQPISVTYSNNSYRGQYPEAYQNAQNWVNSLDKNQPAGEALISEFEADLLNNSLIGTLHKIGIWMNQTEAYWDKVEEKWSKLEHSEKAMIIAGLMVETLPEVLTGFECKSAHGYLTNYSDPDKKFLCDALRPVVSIVQSVAVGSAMGAATGNLSTLGAVARKVAPFYSGSQLTAGGYNIGQGIKSMEEGHILSGAFHVTLGAVGARGDFGDLTRALPYMPQGVAKSVAEAMGVPHSQASAGQASDLTHSMPSQPSTEVPQGGAVHATNSGVTGQDFDASAPSNSVAAPTFSTDPVHPHLQQPHGVVGQGDSGTRPSSASPELVQEPGREFYGGRGEFTPSSQDPEWGTHVGQSSGRPFFPDEIGTPIQRLSTAKIKVQHNGIDAIEHHLSRFSTDQKNVEQIQRLRELADKPNIEPTQADLDFYAHELREYVRFRILGYKEGLPTNPDEAARLWNNAHTAALEDYGIREAPRGHNLDGDFPWQHWSRPEEGASLQEREHQFTNSTKPEDTATNLTDAINATHSSTTGANSGNSLTFQSTDGVAKKNLGPLSQQADDVVTQELDDVAAQSQFNKIAQEAAAEGMTKHRFPGMEDAVVLTRSGAVPQKVVDMGQRLQRIQEEAVERAYQEISRNTPPWASGPHYKRELGNLVDDIFKRLVDERIPEVEVVLRGHTGPDVIYGNTAFDITTYGSVAHHVKRDFRYWQNYVVMRWD
jgi:hypothetical protein